MAKVKVKVAEASDVVLDYMVALALGHNIVWDGIAYWISDLNTSKLIGSKWKACGKPCGWSPSTYGNDGMPIIEREGIGFFCNRTMKMGVRFKPNAGADWRAFAFNKHYVHHFGPTALIAAMRCYAISELGPEVEVPDELLGE